MSYIVIQFLRATLSYDSCDLHCHTVLADACRSPAMVVGWSHWCGQGRARGGRGAHRGGEVHFRAEHSTRLAIQEYATLQDIRAAYALTTSSLQPTLL